jgi:hypothetical protein
MAWGPLASASVVFLVLYAGVFCILNILVFTKRISLKSRWFLLYLHVLTRLAAQGCGP